jgi:ssDNA-binding Zn-finger/Zn-ribbon topoisomerase 1
VTINVVGKCPNCGAPVAERNGKYGKFLSCTAYPRCKTICLRAQDGTLIAKAPRQQPQFNDIFAPAQSPPYANPFTGAPLSTNNIDVRVAELERQNRFLTSTVKKMAKMLEIDVDDDVI